MSSYHGLFALAVLCPDVHSVGLRCFGESPSAEVGPSVGAVVGLGGIEGGRRVVRERYHERVAAVAHHAVVLVCDGGFGEVFLVRSEERR